MIKNIYRSLAAALLLAGQSTAAVAAENATSAEESAPAPQSQAPAQTQQAYPYPQQRYPRYSRGWNRPFGSSGPSFRGPWNSGRGNGFGFSSDDGPGWGSGPRWGSAPRWNNGPRYQGPAYGQGYDNRYYDGYYNRGPRFSGPWNNNRWGGDGMSFGW